MFLILMISLQTGAASTEKFDNMAQCKTVEDIYRITMLVAKKRYEVTCIDLSKSAKDQ